MTLPVVIANIVIEYIGKHSLTMPISKVNWCNMALNKHPSVTDFLNEKIELEFKNFNYLCSNSIPDFSSTFGSKRFWRTLIINASSIGIYNLIERYLNKHLFEPEGIKQLNFTSFGQLTTVKCASVIPHSGIIKLLKDHNLINWNIMSGNSHSDAVDLIKDKINNSKDEKQNQFDVFNRTADDLNWDTASNNTNPRMIDILRKKLSYDKETKNDARLSLSNKNRINWSGISKLESTEAVALLNENRTEIDWVNLSCNSHPDAIILLNERLLCELKLITYDTRVGPAVYSKLCMARLAKNTNPKANDIIKSILTTYPCYVNNLPCYDLMRCANSFIIAHLEKNSLISSWNTFACNNHPDAVVLLLQNLDKNIWNELSSNSHPDIVSLMLENPDKINLSEFSRNPGCFQTDHDYNKRLMAILIE
jgi:hypothetical protein